MWTRRACGRSKLELVSMETSVAAIAGRFSHLNSFHEYSRRFCRDPLWDSSNSIVFYYPTLCLCFSSTLFSLAFSRPRSTVKVYFTPFHTISCFDGCTWNSTAVALPLQWVLSRKLSCLGSLAASGARNYINGCRITCDDKRATLIPPFWRFYDLSELTLRISTWRNHRARRFTSSPGRIRFFAATCGFCALSQTILFLRFYAIYTIFLEAESNNSFYELSIVTSDNSYNSTPVLKWVLRSTHAHILQGFFSSRWVLLDSNFQILGGVIFV